jgi:small subunit ribosomal protein S8
MSNHAVSDLVSRIKNGYLAKKITITSPVSRLREEVLRILKEEGYLTSYTKSKNKNFETFDINLKYFDRGIPVITKIESVSKPGRRIYCKFKKIPLVKNGLGIALISTSDGILADYEARVKKLGGEILFKVF